MDLNLGYALGLFAGSGTSTASLQAAIATLATMTPRSAIRCRTPFGVAGPILISLFRIRDPQAEGRHDGGFPASKCSRSRSTTRSISARRSARS